jgi:hypothetical protein
MARCDPLGREDRPNFVRCDAFWAREETDRPLIAARVGGWTSENHYPAGLASLANGRLAPGDFRFEAFRPDYEMLYAWHRATGADVPWAAFPPFPMPWLEAIVGCPIHHRDGTIWAGHWLDSYDQLSEIDLSAGNAWLDKLLEFTDKLVTLSGGRFPVALALMRGPADLLSALRGPERMVLDLFDYPGQLDETLQRLTAVWIAVAEAQRARIPAFEGGYAFSVINLWGRGPCGWFQDDAVALWSPHHYRRHLRICEERLSRSMLITGIHLHPSPLFMIDELLDMPQLDVIEINLDVNGPGVEELIPQLTRIVERKNLALWGEFTAHDYRILRQHLPARGLLLQVMGATVDQVRASINTLKRLW